jgi:two-component system response regulator PhoP
MYRIAIVEDENLIRTMLKLNLQRVGYVVECFVDAESLMLRLTEIAFDLILLDISLPGISGEQMMQNVRQQGIITPVLMVTARCDLETKLRAFERGADDYITKPFDMSELLARIKALIRRCQKEYCSSPSHDLICEHCP